MESLVADDQYISVDNVSVLPSDGQETREGCVQQHIQVREEGLYPTKYTSTGGRESCVQQHIQIREEWRAVCSSIYKYGRTDYIMTSLKGLKVEGSGVAEGSPHPLVVRNAAALVTRILRVFGLSSAGPDELGFGGEAVKQGSGEQYLNALTAFRVELRSAAKAKAPSSDIMAICDRWAAPGLTLLP